MICDTKGAEMEMDFRAAPKPRNTAQAGLSSHRALWADRHCLVCEARPGNDAEQKCRQMNERKTGGVKEMELTCRRQQPGRCGSWWSYLWQHQRLQPVWTRWWRRRRPGGSREEDGGRSYAVQDSDRGGAPCSPRADSNRACLWRSCGRAGVLSRRRTLSCPCGSAHRRRRPSGRSHVRRRTRT